MTNKEKEILEIIKSNPTIEQSEIAKIMKISRSTVAVHISSLQKQGYLLGKGYIISDDNYIRNGVISLISAMNIYSKNDCG